MVRFWSGGFDIYIDVCVCVDGCNAGPLLKAAWGHAPINKHTKNKHRGMLLLVIAAFIVHVILNAFMVFRFIRGLNALAKVRIYIYMRMYLYKNRVLCA
jgi:hypothetical protein